MTFDQVSAGQSSNINCSQWDEAYKGKISWKCEHNGNFEKIPKFLCYKKWIEEIKTNVTEIQNINDTMEYSKIVNNKTKSEELEFHEEVKLFLDIIEILRMKFDDFGNKEDYKVAINFTKEIINSCSNLLNQNQAWNSSDSSDSIERESSSIRIMFQLQYSAFTLGCHVSDPQLLNHFKTANIDIESYLSTNQMFNETIKYQANYSSILIPPNLNVTKDYKCTNKTIAFGGLYNRIGDHVERNLPSNTKLNSKIIVFSMTNSTNKFELPKGNMVKIR